VDGVSGGKDQRKHNRPPYARRCCARRAAPLLLSDCSAAYFRRRRARASPGNAARARNIAEKYQHQHNIEGREGTIDARKRRRRTTRVIMAIVWWRRVAKKIDDAHADNIVAVSCCACKRDSAWRACVARIAASHRAGGAVA
jgi:hypothetical protein